MDELDEDTNSSDVETDNLDIFFYRKLLKCIFNSLMLILGHPKYK